jgi:hypothetical protein
MPRGAIAFACRSVEFAVFDGRGLRNMPQRVSGHAQIFVAVLARLVLRLTEARIFTV